MGAPATLQSDNKSPRSSIYMTCDHHLIDVWNWHRQRYPTRRWAKRETVVVPQLLSPPDGYRSLLPGGALRTNLSLPTAVISSKTHREDTGRVTKAVKAAKKYDVAVTHSCDWRCGKRSHKFIVSLCQTLNTTLVWRFLSNVKALCFYFLFFVCIFTD